MLGWLTVLKGVMLLAVPLSSLTVATSLLGSGGWWRVGMVITALVGAYLCWVGWVGERKNAASGALTRSER